MKAIRWMRAVKCAAREMPKYETTLCLIDTTIGDGDHGVTIARGYNSIENGVNLNIDTPIEAFCRTYSSVMSDSMGGAIGPIYGILWKTFGRELSGKEEISTMDMAHALQAASEKIQKICQVKQGEKTVLDAIIPTAEAFFEAKHLSLYQATQIAAKSAQAGAERTKEMIALKGRARYLKEKSIGHVDAGASSFALWMEELANCMKYEENKDGLE